MKRIATLLMFVAAVAFITVNELSARGGRGGGGRAGGGGARAGGGMSRPSASRSPALSGGGARPSQGMSRPSTASRPSTGARPSTGGRPGTGAAARSGAGAATRPATGARAGGGAGAATRPATGARAGGASPVAGRGSAARPGIAAGRPTAGQLDNFLDIPRPSTGAIGAGAAIGAGVAGGAAAEFLRDGGGARPATLPANRLPGERPIAGDRPITGERPIAGDRPIAGQRPGVSERPGVQNRQDRRQDFAQNRPERIDNRQQWQDNRQQRRDEVRGQIADNYPRLDFWSDHPNWAAWRINRPYRWATWGALTGWVGYGWSEPAYYNYGDNIYYSGDEVYYGDQVSSTTEQYAQQAEDIVVSAPEKQPQDSEWLPLGVFAITQDGQATGADPTLFVQLAISKEGIIAGTFKNMATGETQTLEGMADKKSQRSAWGVAGKQRPIMETGIYNLTQDTAPALVHFADGQTQQWLLVRLEEPKAQPQAPATKGT